MEDLKVYVCLCLIDHMVVGVGLSRDECLREMIAELNARHGDHWGQDDADDLLFGRN